MWDSLPPILLSNKVRHRASYEEYGAFENEIRELGLPYGAFKQPPFNWGSTSFSRAFEQSTQFIRHLSHFWLHLWAHNFCSTFEDSIHMVKLGAWLWYYVRNHDSLQWYDIIHLEHKFSWFYFWFSQKASYQWDVFLTYKPMILGLFLYDLQESNIRDRNLLG